MTVYGSCVVHIPDINSGKRFIKKKWNGLYPMSLELDHISVNISSIRTMIYKRENTFVSCKTPCSWLKLKKEKCFDYKKNILSDMFFLSGKFQKKRFLFCLYTFKLDSLKDCCLDDKIFDVLVNQSVSDPWISLEHLTLLLKKTTALNLPLKDL